MTQKTRARNASSISAIRKSNSYAHAVLTESANILIKTGHSPRELVEEFRQICGAVPEPSRRFDPRCVAYVEGLPHIVAHWFADPAYVDDHGKPLPLRLRARGPCLANLIQHVLPGHDPDEVAESLIKIHAVRRRGTLYVPIDRRVSMIKHARSAQMHRLASLVGMLKALRHNVSDTEDSDALLERAIANPHIPVRALPAVHRRIKREVEAFLWKIDGYLRRCEVDPDSEPTTRVGVGAYAYGDPVVTGARGARKPPEKNRSDSDGIRQSQSARVRQ
jgi:hypothetical protein